MERVVKWLASNKLSLNVEKTKYMVFDTINKQASKCSKTVSICDMPIKRVQNTVFLGLTINENLSWKPHMQNMLQKLRRNFGIIVKIKPYLGTSNLVCLYHTMIESHLRYCISVWRHGHEGLAKKLQKVCDKFIAMLTKSSEPFNQQFLSIEELYALETSIFMFKSHNNLLPECFSNLFQYVNEIHSIPTRNKNSLYLPYFSKTLTQQSIQFSGVKAWNNVPISLRNLQSKSLFSHKLRKHLLNNKLPTDEKLLYKQ